MGIGVMNGWMDGRERKAWGGRLAFVLLCCVLDRRASLLNIPPRLAHCQRGEPCGQPLALKILIGSSAQNDGFSPRRYLSRFIPGLDFRVAVS
jgi:hypothetical protein